MRNLFYRIRFWFVKYFPRKFHYKGKSVLSDHFMMNLDNWNTRQHWGNIHPDYAYQYSTPDCVKLDSGNLELSTKYAPTTIGEFTPDFARGELESLGKFNKGVFQIRCKVPSSGWQAYWLWGPINEIDIMEMNKAGKLTSSIHLNKYSERYTSAFKMPYGWHTHTLIWEDDELTFLFDGWVIRKEKISIDEPMWLVVNTALFKNQQPHEHPFLVDWIKVYDLLT